jgi:phospholipase C
MPGSATRANALDHVVVVLFENRSLDNVLGRLYGPGDGKAFKGRHREGAEQPDPRMGRARRWPQGGALRRHHRDGFS